MGGVDGSGPRDGVGGSFVEPILAACDAPSAGGWRVEAQPSRMHVHVRSEKATPRPQQGWKLHVSADTRSAETVLRRALPVLLGEDAGFKVVSSVGRLAYLNGGRGGLPQIGKFITVYPASDEQAVRLAVALDGATRGLGGPTVPSDRPLRSGSLVHYRYGGYDARFVQLPHGEVVPAIAAPDGALVPDVRSGKRHAPPWARDPFVAAGIVSEPRPEAAAEGNGFSGEPADRGGRFAILDTPYRSPTGAVHLALDTEGPRRCVLKRRVAPAGEVARDPRDYLKNEARVLARLAPDDAIPEVYGLVDAQNGDLLLAMEEVAGKTLGEHVGTLGRHGRLVPVDQAIAWGRDLASILGRIHASGFVYNDLKLENVLVAPGGDLRLLDFEYASEAGEEGALGGIGTRGYVSPQRDAGGEPASASDDVYALGALLYALLTRAAPPLAPRAHALADRPVGLLNPSVGSALAGVISRCLDPEPAMRYPSMAAVGRALAEAGSANSRKAAAFGGEPAVEPESEARRRSCELALRLGDTIRAAARPAPEGRGMFWLSRGPGGNPFPLRDLCAGSAGVVFALAGLVAGPGAPGHRDALEAGAGWLASSRPISYPPLPGLYVGDAGVGAALLRAGQVLGDRGLVEAAVGKGRLVSGLPHASPDMFNGSAGRLRFHLMLHDATGDEEHLRHAVAAGEVLLGRAEDAGDGPQWTIPPGYGGMSGQAYLGYAHGTAGIADALLDLFEATQDERFLVVAKDAGRRLARLAVPVLDDEDGLDWPYKEGAPPAGAAWCHGATGIGRFFLRAARLDLVPGAGEFAARAARTVARGARHLGPVRCHGLAGNIEFLLDVYRATGDPAFLAEARSVARILEAFGSEKDGLLYFPSNTPDVFVPDLMTGYAGVMACFLRLADPDRPQPGLRYSV